MLRRFTFVAHRVEHAAEVVERGGFQTLVLQLTAERERLVEIFDRLVLVSERPLYLAEEIERTDFASAIPERAPDRQSGIEIFERLADLADIARNHAQI